MDASPEIAAEVKRVQRRRSTLKGRRSCHSIGGRLSLAAPPTLLLQDQVSQLDENQPWTTNLIFLLDIALREAVRRLETRLPGDECVPELRAAILTQSGDLARQISENVCGLTPTAVDTNEHSTPITSASIDMYKEKTRALEQEYSKWKAMMKLRIAECHAAEREFKEAKSGVTTMNEGQEVHLSLAQRNQLDSWQDCSQFVEEARLARDKAHLTLEEVRHTTEVVNSLLTVSKLQADSSYIALESLSNECKTQPLNQLINSLMEHHLTSQPEEEEPQS